MAGTAAVASGIIEMLKEDHAKVKGLFEDFESAEGREQADIAATAIMELEVHADLEEKLIYPSIRKQIDEDEMMNQAVEEHHLVHVLVKELKKLKPKDEVFQAKFKVLGELVKHHIEEEEGQILPKAQESEIDWDKLETTVMKRRETMTNKLAGQKKASKR
ncbi:hemerythrin domain-containing protein [Candidatus Nitrospira nitrificans]|uniref:Putative Hemerythrin HHE cation binding domain protein n=1 Tax=Candidatus Nitrospira nitrificans TaxID=1742973 RepID=A0A0S4LLL2_9BACT|nr:hemerythrin domain-containing protein [Candidatus Nitrospira nitrificans]CUS37488.1 putative Hemerythrin HHE cation binding domain protein [Candidatus Nitrospira nitrificans]